MWVFAALLLKFADAGFISQRGITDSGARMNSLNMRADCRCANAPGA
jgi:hypothetical protein